MCYSAVGNDARVGKQIRWLEAAGYRVDVLSRRPEHPDATGRALVIGEPRRRIDFIANAFLPYTLRFRRGYLQYIPVDELAGQSYDLVYINDHHLLPWAVTAIPSLTTGEAVLDLHELYSENGTGLVHRLLIGPYDDWLLRYIDSPVFTRRMTVAEGIADIYRDEYHVPRPAVIRNVAPFEPLTPSPVDPDDIVLVHHGLAAVERGIDVMLDAALLLEPRFRLVLMVIGDEATMSRLRAHPAVTSGRASLREPVPVNEVARTVNEYDLEVIFFPHRFPNNKYALPNKFFEAVQGRLGIVIGDSPEMVGLVRENGLGTVVDGWEAADLARVVNALTADEVTRMKAAADRAASDLSTVGEGPRFLDAVGA